MGAAGAQTRDRLFTTALQLFAEKGFEETTLRHVARKAKVSVGLLYRYFPSKRAVVLALYEQLSHAFVERSSRMPEGRWRERFGFALETSLALLGPHREAMRALVPVLVDNAGEGLFSAGTRSFRERVEGVFVRAAVGATDAPKDAEALGRVLYLAHLAVLLWWLLDRSEGRRATRGLTRLFRDALPLAALALRLPQVRAVVRKADALLREGLLA